MDCFEYLYLNLKNALQHLLRTEQCLNATMLLYERALRRNELLNDWYLSYEKDA